MGIIDEKGAYVIVPTADLTEEMMNEMRKDFNVIGDKITNSLRKNADKTKSILIFKTLSSTVFSSYRWYSYSEISEVILEAEWNGV